MIAKSMMDLPVIKSLNPLISGGNSSSPLICSG